MKKLFAILALVVLSSAFAFAADSWTNPTALTGTYTAKIVCTPGLTGPTGSPQSATFFNKFDGDPGMNPEIWTLTGPSEASYITTGSVALTTSPSGSTAPVLEWSMTVDSKPVQYKVGLGSLTETDSFSPYVISCGGNGGLFNPTVPIKLDIYKLTATSATPGSYMWTLTVTVTANVL